MRKDLSDLTHFVAWDSNPKVDVARFEAAFQTRDEALEFAKSKDKPGTYVWLGQWGQQTGSGQKSGLPDWMHTWWNAGAGPEVHPGENEAIPWSQWPTVVPFKPLDTVA